MADDGGTEGSIKDLVYGGLAVLSPQFGWIAPLLVGTLRHLTAQHRENFQHVVDATANATCDMDPETRARSWHRPVFGELFEAMVPSAMRARTETRRNHLANVLAAGLRSDEVTTRRLVALARLLEDVDEFGTLWLQFYEAQHTITAAGEWFEAHPYMRPPSATLGSSTDERLQAALSEFSRERLVTLGLLVSEGRRLRATLRQEKSMEKVVRGILEHLQRQEERQQWTITATGRLLVSVVTRGFAHLDSSDDGEGR